MSRERLRELLDRARSGVVYWTERAVIDFTSDLWEAMRRKRVTQSELAAKVAKNPAYISRILNGAPNITIKTMVEMAYALDMRVSITLQEREAAYLTSPHTAVDTIIEPGHATRDGLRRVTATNAFGRKRNRSHRGVKWILHCFRKP